MSRSRRKFPLVADGVPVIDEPKSMNLYENEDLINNIRGEYHDKDYSQRLEGYHTIGEMSDVTQEPETVSSHHPVRNLASFVPKPPKRDSYSERAKQVAKRDVRKKRQSYVASDIKSINRGFEPVQASQKAQEKPKKTTSLTRFSEKLHQETYILADIKPEYKVPNNAEQNRKNNKNNYDFLKNSQIYNRPDSRQRSERKVAQELNLTKIDDDME